MKHIGLGPVLDGEWGMWFDPRVKKWQTLIVVTFTILIGCLAGAAHAADTPGLNLPAGEVVIDLEWYDDGGLVLLVVKDGGYALRRVELDTGDISVLAVPRDFGNIRHDNGPQEDTIVNLGPGGRHLAVIERSANPLYGNELSVYKVSPGGLESLANHRVPTAFNPNECCFSPDGNELYLAARPYVNPDQPYSIGRYDLSTEEFTGVVLKANLDLIDQIVALPKGEGVAVVCRSWRGEFPLDQVAVIAGGGEDRVVHGSANGYRLVELADGRLLFGDATGGIGGAGEAWVLKPGAEEAVPADAAYGVNPSLQSTADGMWLGLLKGYDPAPGLVGYELVLQNPAGQLTVDTSEECSAFAFSPAGNAVCAVSADGTTLYFYELPG